MGVTAAASVDELLAALALGVDEPEPSEIAEGADPVSELAHALQCAAVLAASHPDDLELQVAGLVHDLGHALVPGDVQGHGTNGRAFVEPLLGARVGALVELHVPAKRWLVTVDPTYRAGLSAGSIRTLARQGEGLSPDERARFEADPHHADAVVLRRADEAAKVAGLDVGSLDRWAATMAEVAAAAGRYSTG